jgi:branched-chain amino acid transport system permease protein
VTQIIVNGLLSGATYALLGLGYTLVFGVMHLLTLAHGVVFMASALLALALSNAGTPVWLALLYAVVIGATLSAVTDFVSFRPTGYDRPISAAVSTIGYALVIDQSVRQIRGSTTVIAVRFSVPDADIVIGGLLISGTQLVGLVLVAVVLVAMRWFVKRSRWGMAMRAFADDPPVVGLLGVPVRRLTVVTLLIAGALAGIASFLLAIRDGGASPLTGLELGLTGLAIMTIGGLGSHSGAVVAGFGLGVAQSFASYYGLAGYQAAVPWILLIAVLLVRPQGLARRVTA